MDNAVFHKRADIQQLFKQAGQVLEYLPAYSPDFNPIEPKWAQAKAIRKQKTVQLRNFLHTMFRNYHCSDLYNHFILPLL
jgi:transposase